MRRSIGFGVCNLAALVVASLHAYHQSEKSLYRASVYFASSRLCSMVLGTWGLFWAYMLARGLMFLSFGPLRLIEIEHITENGWITLSETFLAMTMFKEEIDAKFIYAFALLFAVKLFHWIVRDRVEWMEQTLQLPRFFIAKLAAVLTCLACLVGGMAAVNVGSVWKSGPSMAILFANEYALTGIVLIGSAVRFGLNCFDALRPDAPFEHRSTVLFYLNFAVDLLKLVVYTVFFCVVMYYYGLPLHIIRDLYVTALSFVRRIRDMITYQRVMASIDTRYPDVDPSEMDSLFDRTCVICREEMSHGAKKLPCGHFFHFKCLKSWLERQQVCPTCRTSVLDDPKPAHRPRRIGSTDSRHSRTSTPTEASSASASSPTGNSQFQNEPMPNASPLLLASFNSPSPTVNSATAFSGPTQLGFRTAPFIIVPQVGNENANGSGEGSRPSSHFNAAELPSLEAEMVRASRRSRAFSSILDASEASTSTLLGARDPEFVEKLRGQSLEHVTAQIEYVEVLLEQHQHILNQLYKVKQVMCESQRGEEEHREKRHAASDMPQTKTSHTSNDSKCNSDSDEKSPLFQ